ncbi:DUF262 domain-containing protein [Paenibacillus sp. GP183]|uniref:DUF262 domain-containing protein n=1 Tax=Paenibacillus sp. GP183 TaxID=1882751 RepID=UPI000894B3C3|nr:DUF262 domain-containing protein [Paenibacillus sp. GP183]SED14789.1 Uncharacterized conserved protein, contains ParB-like and HNH nuclease domains [Paenibacillus sp. GP183]
MDVTPDKQNIDKVFSSTTYYIDFYQRQYKWTDEPVRRLLDDIFYKFNTEYKQYKDNDIELDQLVERYSWYYLNTYVTNTIDGKVYIVDGQQRLTTLTLILIKLMHTAKQYGSELRDWISGKIAGQSGFRREFWMNHEQHKTAMSGLYADTDLDTIDTTSGITAVNLVSNYRVISVVIDRELTDKHRLENFIFYFLKRLVLINLNVEQTDVPMVFEVINDRGVKLKPYEILKGKLLGQIQKDELDQLGLNDLWESQVNKINAYQDDDIDEFFIYYLRSKFAKTVGDTRKFDRSYHRNIFLSEVEQKLKLQHNPKEVKRFLQNDFKYYTELYHRVLQYYNKLHQGFQHVYYNSLTEMDSQFLLILSSCTLSDPEETEKIKLISYEVDRLFSLLQLQKSYDSNDFNELIYLISSEIRGQGVHTIKSIFDKYLLQMISEARGVLTTQALTYSYFKDTGIELNKRFKRYFFARIEQFIADETLMQMKHSLYDLVANTGTVNGFHIEHILADNSQNLQAFGNDQEQFERERNRLGGLLLLKGKDNISSSNEKYSKKLKTYANTLYWNETLREDSYKTKIDFSNMIKTHKLKFRPVDDFGPTELEERHTLLYELIGIIWG